MELRILELFSGIGGMHYAFDHSRLAGHVVAAMDINTVANAVYAHNHAKTPVMNNNIQKLSTKMLEKLMVNTILMSPPCQPHTRVGQKRDISDHRSDALNHICDILPQCVGIQYILMENVKGFEASLAREMYINALKKAGFCYREFILTPTQKGVPNTRHRYYCIARREDFDFPNDRIWQHFPEEDNSLLHRNDISSLVDYGSEDLLLNDDVLRKRVWLLDIVTRSANNTMCFTKAYTHYSEGTGSVYCPLELEEMQSIFAELKNIEQKENNSEQVDQLLRSLQLRYFSPKEVARLMSFPETFSFPEATTNRQKYRLLGNSINVCVVGELIKLMCK